MNEESVRRMIAGLSEDVKYELGGMLVGLAVKVIKEVEDSIEDGREREVYELGKHIGVLEHSVEEYEKL